MSTPIRDICFDPAVDAVTTRLAADYFGLATLDDGQSVEYQLPYGEWIRLFRRHQLVVEDLIELRAPAQATTRYPDFCPCGVGSEMACGAYLETPKDCLTGFAADGAWCDHEPPRLTPGR